MNLLDEFLIWKVKAIRKEVEAGVRFRGVLRLICSSFYFVQVYIYQNGLKEIEHECVQQLKYEHYTLLSDGAKAMPLKWYEAQPVFSKKIVVMHLLS